MRTKNRIRRILGGLAALTVLMPGAAFAQDTAQQREDVLVPLSRHKPIYAVYGEPTPKAQISFKFEIYPYTELFFAYTETAFWLLREESVPFYDIKFEPELFYRHDLPTWWLDFVRLGLFSHSSNGEDGADSRSYDEGYLELVTELDPGGVNFHWSNKFFTYYGLGENNLDIRSYRSVYETTMSFHVGLFPGDQLRWRGFLRREDFGPGRKDHYHVGGVQVGYMFPSLLGVDFAPQFYVQYYNGYMESWKAYDQREEIVRAGIRLK
ncbi:phospholipase A [Thiohalorhabdus sp. Cl-TMA]|uniref:Phospholipase A1 n=1 Tax=Thiohalorhabdus methylotrophus TaxID=3242694 RepID=A0ABV4TT67_9GAMM